VVILRLYIPQSNEEVLFEETLEPTISTLGKLAKEKRFEGQVENTKGIKAKVSVGKPILVSVISEDKFDIHTVSLSCSFLPDNNCKIIWTRFRIELNAESKSGKPTAERPIVLDMFPDKVLSEIEYEREFNFEPDLSFNSSIIKANPKFGFRTKKNYIAYKPQIYSYGIRTPDVCWDFKSTEQCGVWGNNKDLLLKIQTPKGSRIKGKFFLGAEIEYNAGKLIRIPIAMRKKDENAVKIEYALSA
jgi:hypothetical protein